MNTETIRRLTVDAQRLLHRAACGAVLLPLLVAGCGDASPATNNPATPASTPQASVPPMAQAPGVAGALPGAQAGVREFSEDELVRYIAAIRAVRALGPPTQAQLSGDPSELQRLFVGMQNAAQFDTTVASHGFDRTSFLQVHSSVISAYGALLVEEQQPALDQAKAKQAAALEKLKGQLPEAQFEQMKQMSALADTTLEAYRNVPPGNQALIAGHRAEFESAIGK